MKKNIYMFIILLTLFILDSVCFADVLQIKKMGEAFYITHTNGTYEYHLGKQRKNAVGHGYIISEQNTLRGVYFDNKSEVKECLFIVIPSNEGPLINILAWSWFMEKNTHK